MGRHWNPRRLDTSKEVGAARVRGRRYSSTGAGLKLAEPSALPRQGVVPGV